MKLTLKVKIGMIRKGSIHISEQQIEKLMEHCGLNEWVAVDPETGEVYKGGDPGQGWSTMKMAIKLLYAYYTSKK